MRQIAAIAIIMAMAAMAIPALAYEGEEIVLSERTGSWENPNCEATDTCGLEEVMFTVQAKKVEVWGSYSYLTKMVAGYRTTTDDMLEDYVFVQFIRGCKWSTFDSGRSRWSVRRHSFGKEVDFRFDEWVVDSTADADPVFRTAPGEARHYGYLVEPAHRSENDLYYYEVDARNSTLYVRDMPGTSFYNAQDAEAINSSLELRTCLYRESDVPTEVEPTSLDFAEPLYCFTWSDSWVYDHEAGEFTSPPYDSEVCR